LPPTPPGGGGGGPIRRPGKSTTDFRCTALVAAANETDF